MSHLLLQSKLELRSNEKRSKESGRGRMQKRDRATKEKLARLVGNAWNVRTRSRTVFCECVRVYTNLYACMFASGKHCALRKSKRRAPNGGDPNYASASGGEISAKRALINTLVFQRTAVRRGWRWRGGEEGGAGGGKDEKRGKPANQPHSYLSDGARSPCLFYRSVLCRHALHVTP